ncbi:hypothetical protein Acor_80460 [Acrocarpospora corrugata]|uniref:Uncharacterized protein n=1 Tax=Acrocarpospora corrugata TaxID=35763 RepID=A0A5M3WA81_9ACTN|nr:hypothetical protein Acor_80460 [Acrocarpospora corrugata]
MGDEHGRLPRGALPQLRQRRHHCERLRGVNDDAKIDRAEAAPVEADLWYCLRGEEPFTPYPCPSCGSYQIEGSHGVSGVVFEKPLAVVSCFKCHKEFPPSSSVQAHGS